MGMLGMATKIVALLLFISPVGTHAAVLLPNFLAEPTVLTIAHGRWDAPTTWQGGRVPGHDDVVLITHEVLLDTTTAAATTIGVNQGGSLQFSPNVDTALHVGTLVVLRGGTVEVGTAAAPIVPGRTAQIVIRDHRLDLDQDPEQWGTGLLVHDGTIRLHGTPRVPFVRTMQEPLAGDTTLILSLPMDWRPGDTIYLPTSQAASPGDLFAPQSTQNEEHVITSIVPSGTVALTTPLQFSHLGAREEDEVVALPHVANLSRNVIVRSENPAGTRGHIAFIGRALVDVRYVRFEQLGRTNSIPQLNSTTFDENGTVLQFGTNQTGRYALHAHHLFGPEGLPDSDPQFALVGNVVVDSRKWGIAIHNSHFGLIQGNVVIRTTGAGIVTEDGSESFNVFEDNFVAHITGTAEPPYGTRRHNADLAHEGLALWFAGPNNYIRSNVGINTTRAAFAVVTFNNPGRQKIPRVKSADPHLDGVDFNAKNSPLLEFAGNEAYGGAEKGLEFWELNAAGDFLNSTGESLVRGFTAWHVRGSGVFSRFAHHVTLEDIRVIGAPSRNRLTGIDGKHRVQHRFVVRRARISSCAVGIEVPDLPGRPGTAPAPYRIEDSVIRCAVGIYRQTLNEGEANPVNVLETLPPRRVEIHNTRVEPTNFVARAVNPATLWAIQSKVLTGVRPARGINAVREDVLVVTNWQGIVGDNFRVYYANQAPDAIVPQTEAKGDERGRIVGVPEAGLTNAQAWMKHGLASAGAIAPCIVTRSEIGGYVCSIDAPR